jgi:hypothetical protein
VGDQDDTVAEERDAGAPCHQAFLELDVRDAALVDTGIADGGGVLGDGVLVFAQGFGMAGKWCQSAV